MTRTSKKQRAKEREGKWKELLERETPYQDYQFPVLSIIIPTRNNSEKISLTIDSVLSQRYPIFEIIIVDAGSTDRTLEVVRNYRDERMHIYSVSGFERYEMLNKGITQAKGEYVNCLFPGDFYIRQGSLLHMMELALDNDKPHLVYCGTLIRDGKSEPKILLRPLTLKLLKKGLQPTSLQSCWFRTDMLRKLGKFDTDYRLRGGFELMCRFCLHQNLREASTNWILTDYDLRLVTREMIIRHFLETFKTIYRHFGLFTTIRWLFIQKDFSRIIRTWVRGFKAAFFRS
ncbi:MAG: glycosyltransferase [Waddliaceae bacterium]